MSFGDMDNSSWLFSALASAIALPTIATSIVVTIATGKDDREK